MMSGINVPISVLISLLEKDHSMIETRRLKNVDIYIYIYTITFYLIKSSYTERKERS